MSRGWRRAARLAGATSLIGVTGWIALGTGVQSAFADSSPYELYCPGTPVGNIALNGVVTTATISPASPAAGSAFQITNYQTSLTIPASIAGAAAALGNTSITGSATATLDATGATPASVKSPTLAINTPIPSPVPSAGIQLKLPDPAASIPGFTASGGAITVSEDKAASLTLVVSGNNLTLTCTAYANNAIPNSGITTATPPGSPISPQIATATAGGGGGGGGTSATTTTTAAPVTSPSSSPSSLAFTGTGPGIYLLGEIGLGGLAAAALLTLGYRARTAFASASRGRRERQGG